jgi:hypothetical protein
MPVRMHFKIRLKHARVIGRVLALSIRSLAPQIPLPSRMLMEPKKKATIPEEWC